ncbi:MAG TPA: cysteine desulfurase family protein [Pseudonocardiaceae bacterium]|jgi:cysteine desulfurase|nr:cysteine desulfurase family protein [Pseudonocardiaceae bacterium]
MLDRTVTHPALAGGPIYVDYNATTPIDPRVTDAMLPYLTGGFGNPSSDHHYGAGPRAALDQARAHVAALVDGGSGHVVFTGSGSAADNLAIRGAVLAAGADRTHVVTQDTEHPAVLAACQALARWHGARVTVLPVDHDGLVAPAALADAVGEHTALVSIMAANNETGAIQPVAELAAIAHARGALFHCDAAQAVGRIPISMSDVDLLTVVGHKLYAPKGIGALLVRPGVALEPLVYGGGQESGLLAGTENVPLAVGLGEAARLAAQGMADGEPERLRALRDRLHDGLAHALPGRVLLNGPRDARLPNTLNVSVTGIEGHTVLATVPALAASTGSACHSDTHEPSPVLTAMGLDARRALAAVRLSVGRYTSEADVDRVVDLLASAA